jgi:hypothetical protein
MYKKTQFSFVNPQQESWLNYMRKHNDPRFNWDIGRLNYDCFATADQPTLFHRRGCSTQVEQDMQTRG